MSLLAKLFSRQAREPNLLSPHDLELWQRAEAALNRVRPMLQMDGGNIDLVSVEGRDITVRLTGACSHCASSTITMRDGVEKVLREEIPDLDTIHLC